MRSTHRDPNCAACVAQDLTILEMDRDVDGEEVRTDDDDDDVVLVLFPCEAAASVLVVVVVAVLP